MTEEGHSSLNTELASVSLEEDEMNLLGMDLLERLEPEDLSELRKHFFKVVSKKHRLKYRAPSGGRGNNYSGLPLSKQEFLRAVDKGVSTFPTGNTLYSLSAAKLFSTLDVTKEGVIWWEEFLDHVIDRIGQRNQKDDCQPLDKAIIIHDVPHCKVQYEPTLLNLALSHVTPPAQREMVMRVVPIETETSFCYAIISKFGRTGVYDGHLQLLETYQILLREGEGRVKSTWVTDAVHLPDAGALAVVCSDRSLRV
uniref:EF-hand domain-containing protein n=1 Tax=Timema bartmani TaxID=61472 RepID=A0A7R9F4M7_9NEOP|nr:unnamed protein product [Timema bartmani]